MDYELIGRSARLRRGLRQSIVYFLLSIWALFVLFPFYWMVMTSFKSYSAYNGEFIPRLITAAPTLENYFEAFSAVPLGKYFLNTVIFTAITTGIMLAVTVLAAFAFARLDFPGRDLMFTLFLALMMIPAELVVITNFVTVTNWELRNTFTGLVLPSVTSVFYIYLLREHFSQIPDEMYYAAKTDGTSDLKYLLKVMVPMCKPTLMTLVLISFIGGWNSYFWPKIIANEKESVRVLTVGLAHLKASMQDGLLLNAGEVMAGAAISISPVLVMFAIFQKQMLSGYTKAAMK